MPVTVVRIVAEPVTAQHYRGRTQGRLKTQETVKLRAHGLRPYISRIMQGNNWFLQGRLKTQETVKLRAHGLRPYSIYHGLYHPFSKVTEITSTSVCEHMDCLWRKKCLNYQALIRIRV